MTSTKINLYNIFKIRKLDTFFFYSEIYINLVNLKILN